MSRLLREYPPDSLTVLTSTRYAKVSPQEGRLSCDEIVVPLNEAYGRFGLGRIRAALNWLRVPLVAVAVRRIIQRQRVSAVLTVLHGHFYFAAAIAARLSGIPYVVIVHDEYASGTNIIARQLTAAVMRNAAHIYAVSPEMQATIRVQFGVQSELQRPATERLHLKVRRGESKELSIVFAGSITGAVEDSLRMVVSVIASGQLKSEGISGAKLHLYTVLKEQQKRAWGWYHPDIVIHPWIAQSELTEVLDRADILFLPFSFSASERHTVQTAFPSKTADYLASGTPILVVGPDYSSLVSYAKREGFAEIVSELDPDLLTRAIGRLALDPDHREVLRSRSLHVFARYHDIGRQRNDFLRMLNSVVRGSDTNDHA